MKRQSAPFQAGQALLFDAQDKRWLSFTDPLEIIIATRAEQVLPALEYVERQVASHRYAAAGWISYEAAPAFDEAFAVHQDPSGFPLLRFALHRPPKVSVKLPAGLQAVPLFDWTDTVTLQQYLTAIDRIKKYIAEGDTYQVNYTYRKRAKFNSHDPSSFIPFIDQPPPFFGGMINDEQWLVASGSPELFFTMDNGLITSRPMKGTASRGMSYMSDREQAAALFGSEKDRAENVMIVDMVRNDLGRIAEPGTVRVTDLFSLEQYPTLHQMTSNVQARTVAGISEVISALFPPASITGAPKNRTMEIIRELEATPRRIYTGSIGFILPGNRSQFNVAIRTLLLDRCTSEVEYGVGSGIVWDSQPLGEFSECATKTIICRPPPPSFSLLETIRWSPEEGFAYLAEHMQRLGNSATYFDIAINLEEIQEHLQASVYNLVPVPHKIRLLVDRAGRVSLEHSILEPQPQNFRAVVTLALKPVEESCFLYHKTTNRTVYEQAKSTHDKVDDVLLYNSRGELTESTIANIIMVKDGTWYTPPVRCGLLPGTAREYLVSSGRLVEKVLPVDLLEKEHDLFLINSVRGIYPALYLEKTGNS